MGIITWPEDLPEIKQEFAGEALMPPQDTAGANPPLISVIMPIYNACRIDKGFLLRALESVVNQTYRNLELIVVDDGSKDISLEVCRNFLDQYPDFEAKILVQKNGGQSRARNQGVKACKGKYISFIDQDDEWYTNKFERIVPWLADKNIDVVYTDGDTINANGELLDSKIHLTRLAGWPHPKRTVEDILFKDVFVMPGVMVIKKEIFESVGGFDENLSGYEDDDLFLRLFEKGRIFYLPISTLRWRLYGDNYSLSARMTASRSYYCKKLLSNHTDKGANKFRERMIAQRFFWEFIYRALDQYDAGNERYAESIEGAREIIPFLHNHNRLLFRIILGFPVEYSIRFLVLVRKAANSF